MPEILEVRYPGGLTGVRPRPVARGAAFKIICNDPGTLEVKFQGHSPIQDNRLSIGPDHEFVAFHPGNFHFACTLVTPTGERLEIDGGEIEVLPGN